MARGAEVDGAFSRFVEQRGPDLGMAVDGSLRAGLGGELHAGADRPYVGLVEEGRARQGDDYPLEVGIAWARGDDGAKGGVGAAAGAAAEAEGEGGLEAQAGAVGRLKGSGAGERGVI